MSPSQKHRFVRIAITSVIFFSFALVFLPFTTPLLMAALLAFALDPIVSRYSLRRSKRRAPILLILLSFMVLFTLPIVLVIFRVIDKVRSISIQAWQETPIFKSVESLLGWGFVQAQSMGINVSQDDFSHPAGLIGKAGAYVVGFGTGLAARTPELMLGLFVFSCALFYFLTDSKTIRRAVERLDLLTKVELKQIIAVVQRTSYITLVSTFLIGALQATIVAIGSWVSGFHEFLLVFILTLLFSFVPIVGAAPVAFLMAALSFASSDVSGGVIMLIVGVVAGSIDNIIKPLILSAEEEDVNPVVSLLAIIGAILVYGLPGLLLGPILTRLTFKIVPILFKTDESS